MDRNFHHHSTATMGRLIIFVCFFFPGISYAQPGNKPSCKIEFYLLKSFKPDIDTANELMGPFSVDKSDLEATPFIKDNEILGYFFRTDTTKNGGEIMVHTRQVFEVNTSAGARINKLDLPLCCGKQFALVVNGQVAYVGYFWNFFSSFGCDAITAYSYGDRIEIARKLPDYDYATDPKDPRKSQILLDCLTSSNRMTGK